MAEYTPTTDRRFTVRYVEAQQESGPHRPAMPAHWVIEDGLTIVARLVDIHVQDLPAHDRAVKAEARAEGTRETAAYIERLYPAGLVNRADVLADMEIAADRQSRRIHANGRDRADEIEKETTE